MSKQGIALETSVVAAYKEHGDLKRLLDEFDEAVLAHAVFMRTRARSHRVPKFLVGACGIGFLPSNRPVILEGANNSPVRGVRRDCAEMDILSWVDNRQCAAIGKMSVAANGDAAAFEAINGLARPVLDPCSECRGLLAANPVVPAELPIVSLNVDTGIREDQTLGRVMARYEQITPPLPSSLLVTSADTLV